MTKNGEKETTNKIKDDGKWSLTPGYFIDASDSHASYHEAGVVPYELSHKTSRCSELY